LNQVTRVFATVTAVVFPFAPLAAASASAHAASLVVTAQKAPLRVYLNCAACDENYVRTEVHWVDHVRDRLDADVHILVTTRTTGAGETEYTLYFTGRRELESRADTLKYVTSADVTRDRQRQGLAPVLKMGLARYLAARPDAADIDINVAQGRGEEMRAFPTDDPWNAWVFYVSGGGPADGESRHGSVNLGLDLSASRITEEWKVRGRWDPELFGKPIRGRLCDKDRVDLAIVRRKSIDSQKPGTPPECRGPSFRVIQYVRERGVFYTCGSCRGVGASSLLAAE